MVLECLICGVSLFQLLIPFYTKLFYQSYFYYTALHLYSICWAEACSSWNWLIICINYSTKPLKLFTEISWLGIVSDLVDCETVMVTTSCFILKQPHWSRRVFTGVLNACLETNLAALFCNIWRQLIRDWLEQPHSWIMLISDELKISFATILQVLKLENPENLHT